MHRILLSAVFLLVCVSMAVSAQAQSLSFSLPRTEVGAGLQTTRAEARLSDSQHGGIFVTIAPLDSLVCLVSPDDATEGSSSIDVFVPNGSTDADFYVHGLEGIAASTDIVASAPGFASAQYNVNVRTPAIRISSLTGSTDVPDTDDPFWIQTGLANAGNTTIGTTQRVRVGGTPQIATVTSSDAAVGELITNSTTGALVTVTVFPGESNSPTTVAAGGVAFDGAAAGATTVAASIPGFTSTDAASVDVTVDAAQISYLGMPVDVGSGLLTNTVRARLNGGVHGGVTVHIESGDPTRALVSDDPDVVGTAAIDVFLPDGQTDAVFYVHGLEGATGISAITSSAPGFAPVVDAAQVVTPSFDIVGLVTGLDTLDPVDPFYVRVGLPDAMGTRVQSPQEIRPGAPPRVATLISNDGAVGLLETSTATDDTVTVEIASGVSNSPTTVASGGVAFDGVGAGVAQVQAQIPGFNPTGGSLKSVTVTQPSLGFLGLPSQVGSGLRSSTLRARLGASQHGGVDVTITSVDPSLALVSAASDEVGTASVDVFVPDGQIDALFWVHGLEGQVGQAHITASASGFTADLDSAGIVTPAVELTSLGGSLDPTDPPDAFRAEIGVAFPSQVIGHPIRPGGANVTIDFTVSDAGVAQLETQSTSGAAVSLTLGPLESSTPSSIGGGGVGLKGVAPGSVDVMATAVGFDSHPNATRTVNVLSPSLSFVGLGVEVGAGLQTTNLSARLSGTEHGGTLVHIESLDPAKIILSDAENTIGQAALDVFVPDGAIAASFYAQALDGQGGMVTIEATAPGFTSVQGTLEVVQPGVDIGFLLTTLDVSSADDPFRVRVGPPNSTNASLRYAQQRRAGAPPLLVTVNTSMPTLSELVTLSGSSGVQTTSIAPLSSQSPSTVGAGGVAHRAIGGGSTVVSASIPGFVQTGNAQREVTLTSTGIALPAVPVRLGDGLQSTALHALLSDGSHGGVTLTVNSSDSTKVVVSGDALQAGGETLDIFLSNGQVDGLYYLQAKENATGTVDITATAPGFGPGDVRVEVVDAALQMTLLPDSLDVLEPDQGFLIQVGVPDAGADSLAQLQAVRGGASPLAIGVESSNGLVAHLVTNSDRTDSVGVSIDPGQFQTASTLGGGGIAFDPRTPGPTTVAASAMGVSPTAAASQEVLVTGTLSAVDTAPVRVLALDQNNPNPFNPSTTIRFALPAPGRVSLRIFDLAGRLVTRLVEGDLEAGAYDFRWEGLDERGRRVASGVYLYELRTDQQRLTRKMVMVK